MYRFVSCRRDRFSLNPDLVGGLAWSGLEVTVGR